MTNTLVGSGIANRRLEETENIIGMIVNTVVFRTQLSKGMNFYDLLHQVKEVALEAYEYQDIPFDKLVETIEFERDVSRNPLFQVAFSFHDTPYPKLDWPQLEIALEEPLSNGSSKFDMNIVVIPRHNANLKKNNPVNEEGITLVWEYNTDLFHHESIERMIKNYLYLLESIVIKPERSIAEQLLVSTKEKQRILVDWNDTEKEIEMPFQTIHEVFEEQVRKYPHTLAVSDNSASLTYLELNEKSNQLAHYLSRIGIENTFVGIFLNKSIDMIVAIMAVLKAGGSYVPLDPNYPQDRLRYMIDDANLSVIVTDQSLSSVISYASCETIILNTAWESLCSESKENLSYSRKGDQLAYAIYTSGTTGKPKGVKVGHIGVLNLIDDYQKRRAIIHGDKCSFWAGSSFDASVYEIFSALLTGGSLCIVPETVRTESKKFIEWLEQQQIRNVYFPAYMLTDFKELLKEKKVGHFSMTRMMVGVEPISESLLCEINSYIPGLCIINAYGPTEGTVISTSYEIKQTVSNVNRQTPIGKPIQNTKAYILDQHLNIVPIGVKGELHIGGVGLAHGYINRPDLTRERFIDSSLGRLYKTGDMARYLPNGDIEFLGRDDTQVKINGIRIELADIESVLKNHKNVKDVVVMVREDTEQKRIVAYVVYHQASQTSKTELYEHAKRMLPHTMMPTAYVSLTALPITVNGKIDKEALPLPATTYTSKQFVAPRNPIEEEIAKVWSVLLNQEQVSVTDNFYELGGYSLLATHILFKLNEVFKINLTLKEFFDEPSIVGLATKIQALGSETEKGTKPTSNISRSRRRVKK